MYDYRQCGRGVFVAVVLLGTGACSSSQNGATGGTGGSSGSAGTGGVIGTGGSTTSPSNGGATSGSGATSATGSGGNTPSGSSGGMTSNAGGATSSGGTSSGGSANGGTAPGGATGTVGTATGGAGSGGATGGGGASSGGQWTARAIANPPSYMGSASGSNGCTTKSPTLGFEPVDAAGGKHPLFFYFVGTTFSSSDTSARYDSDAAKKVTEAMARRGFVALSVQYDNTLSLSTDKLTCVYASSNKMSALAIACALPNVDCDLGIATWGHSQGALMAHAASTFEPRVRAVWTTGYSGGTYPLSNDRLRVVNGEGDAMNGNWDTARKAAGYSSSDCSDQSTGQCLRPDGSGFIIVKKKDCVLSTADHCWFDRKFCGDSAITLEPNWIDPASTKPFALEANADWVAKTAARR